MVPWRGIARYPGELPVRTAAQPGTTPAWDEVLTIPFKPAHNDVSTLNLLSIDTVMSVSLFDEVKRSVPHQRNQTHTLGVRTERYYIGSVDLPFSTIYMNGQVRVSAPPLALRAGAVATGAGSHASVAVCQVKGTFELQTPDVMIGYKHQASIGGAAGVDKRTANQKQHTYDMTWEHGCVPLMWVSLTFSHKLCVVADMSR